MNDELPIQLAKLQSTLEHIQSDMVLLKSNYVTKNDMDLLRSELKKTASKESVDALRATYEKDTTILSNRIQELEKKGDERAQIVNKMIGGILVGAPIISFVASLLGKHLL